MVHSDNCEVSDDVPSYTRLDSRKPARANHVWQGVPKLWRDLFLCMLFASLPCLSSSVCSRPLKAARRRIWVSVPPCHTDSPDLTDSSCSCVRSLPQSLPPPPPPPPSFCLSLSLPHTPAFLSLLFKHILIFHK